MCPREPRRLRHQPSPASPRRPHLPHALRHGGRACWGATPTRGQSARQTREHQVVGWGPRAVSSATNTSRTSQACALLQVAVLNLRASHRKQAKLRRVGTQPQAGAHRTDSWAKRPRSDGSGAVGKAPAHARHGRGGRPWQGWRAGMTGGRNGRAGARRATTGRCLGRGARRSAESAAGWPRRTY